MAERRCPTTAQVQAMIDAGGGGDYYPETRFLRASRYHIMPYGTNTTLALVANRLYGVPFFTPVARTITKIAIHVTTLGTSASARLGIYQDGGAVYPTTLISDCGTVVMTSTGLKGITGLSINLSANTLYWLALVCNVVATISAITAGTGWQLLGYSTALNAVAGGYWYATFTYATLPNPFSTTSPVVAAVAIPKIAIYF